MEEETSVVLRDSKEKKETKVVQEIVAKSNVEQRITTSSVNFAAFRSTIEEICQNKQDDIFSKDSPMSLEKSLDKSLEKSLTYSSSSNKEYKIRREYIKEMRTNFFDVDEYRADIYNYLRVSEVRISVSTYNIL